MSEKEFYEGLLSLPSLSVDRVESNGKQISIYCHSQSADGQCPNCLEPSGVVHQTHERKVRDLSISGKEVWLHITARQFICLPCNRYFYERFDWVASGKSYTSRQAKWMFEICAKQPFTEAGALMNICPKTLERNYYQFAQKRINLAQRYKQVRKLGIDEISHRKGKGDYCCVLTDLDRGTQLDILPNRKKETLIKHFEALGPDFAQQIEAVSCDIWPSYISVARQCFPRAKLVIDYFHVIKALNESLNSYRKKLRREAPEQECFKKLKWTLCKRKEKCSETEIQLLEKAFSLEPQLEEMYLLRNSFHHIFDIAPNQAYAIRQLRKWIRDVEFTKIKYWDTFIKTLKRWIEPIANFAGDRISNATTEGLNNLIRYFKRISFGIHNFEHMRLRILASSY